MAIIASKRMRRMFTPNPQAIRSPRARIFRPGAIAIASTIPASDGGTALLTLSQRRPARSPTSQVRIANRVCSSRIRMAAVSDDTMADSATPHSVTFSGVKPPRPADASAITNEKSAAAPPAASNGWLTPVTPSAVHNTTTNAAPAFNPRICGSPSGLRINACNRTPATPNAAPTSIAAVMRSRRKETIIRWSKFFASKWNSACTTVCGLIVRAPTPRCTTARTHNSSVNTGNASIIRPRRRASVLAMTVIALARPARGTA